jgi:hypothetical protein
MGASNTKSIVLDQTNTMVANIFTEVAVSCSNDADVSQSILVNCDIRGKGNVNSITEPYESNYGCRQCIENILQTSHDNYQFQRGLWPTDGYRVKKPINDDFQNVVTSMLTCGRSQCKACSFENLSQKTIVTQTSTCESLNSVQNQITQKLIDQVTQQLTNDQGAVQGFLGIFGGSSTQDVVNELVSRISVKLDEVTISKIRSQINNTQTIKLGLGSITGLTQESAFHSVKTYLGQTNLFNDILSEEQWQIFQKLYNEQNTLNTLGQTVVKTVQFIDRLLKTVTGYVMFFVLIMVGVLFLGLTIFWIVNLVKKFRKQKTEAKKFDAAQSQRAPNPAVNPAYIPTRPPAFNPNAAQPTLPAENPAYVQTSPAAAVPAPVQYPQVNPPVQ